MAPESDLADPTTRIAYRTCPLCEAGCGLEITVKGEQVVRIRGDRDDVFSHGFICPKGSTLKQLHDDPDRLRRPMVKRGGVHVEVEWDEAWRLVAEGLGGVVQRNGREAVGVYMGNPSVHSLSAMLYNRVMLTALGTKRRFSASSVDQLPRQVAGAYVFGSPSTVPVPDLDHTDFLVVIGANPYASNGSLCTAPDFPGRIEAMRERGGTLVVVDPRRSRTAEEADRWLPIRPGTDALLLAAMVTTLAADGAIDPGEHVAAHLNGLDQVVAALAPFTPEAVEAATGIAAADIRQLARDLNAARSGSVYGRIGTTTTEFGTTTSWLVDVVNIVTGNLDRRGGAMFPRPVAGGQSSRPASGKATGFAVGRGHTQVRNLPEVMGEYPSAAMAEEITDAPDPIRAMVTVAGNPVLSTANGDQLDEAFAHLEFMVSIDIYLNETTRHADVVLPPPSQLQRSHYDLSLLNFAVRNVANFSEPVLPLDPGAPDEWEILAKVGMLAAGLGPDADPAAADEQMLRGIVERSVADPNSAIHGRSADEIMAALGSTPGPERHLDFMLQMGAYGAAFGANPGGASLQLLRNHPHGVDYGAMQPRLPDVLRTPSGRIELAHPVLMADLERLAAAMPDLEQRSLVLVGRRHLRSNNSWMHNVDVLVKGKPRCTLQMHPDDAVRLGVSDGSVARVSSRVGSLDAVVELTDGIRPGVVSLPHGWGHGVPGTRMRVAAERAGVNSNLLTDHESLDPLSGTSVLNGIPVEVVPV
ncbi:MAG: hypothetical protein RLZ14_581 [Actinomycetota bacterium]